jgi:hypothetical protein
VIAGSSELGPFLRHRDTSWRFSGGLVRLEWNNAPQVPGHPLIRARIRGLPLLSFACRCHCADRRSGAVLPFTCSKHQGGSHSCHHVARLDLFADIRAAVASDVPGTVLEEGEILRIGNHRCRHGRDGHDTPRLINIMAVRTAEAM